ncbi:hypothetical protein PFISCL1PPCAC_18839, partial [Pristionchus fissidentatus]
NERSRIMRRLMLLKPELVAHSTLLESVLDRIRSSALPVISARRVRMTEEAARRFYETHNGKFFYGRLVRHMTSGDSIALVLATDTGAARRLVGGGKVWPPRSVIDPDTAEGLRHLFSISDVRNVAHVSDDDRAEEELRIIDNVKGEEITGLL